jgi:hypothetical protein
MEALPVVEQDKAKKWTAPGLRQAGQEDAAEKKQAGKEQGS